MGDFRDEARDRHERFRKRLIAGGVVAGVAFAAAETFTHANSGWPPWAFAFAMLFLFWVAYNQFYKRIRCPSCNRSVAKVLLVAPDAPRCPYCSADWTKPLDGT
jgi:hypothetical protein